MRKGKRREAGRRAVAVAPAPPAPSSMGRRALAAAGAREAACPRARLCSEATGRCGRDWRGHAGFARTAAHAAGRARMAARRRSFCACEPLLPPLPPSSKRADIRAHKMAWKEYNDDACCYWGACGQSSRERITNVGVELVQCLRPIRIRSFWTTTHPLLEIVRVLSHPKRSAGQTRRGGTFRFMRRRARPVGRGSGCRTALLQKAPQPQRDGGLGFMHHRETWMPDFGSGAA